MKKLLLICTAAVMFACQSDEPTDDDNSATTAPEETICYSAFTATLNSCCYRDVTEPATEDGCPFGYYVAADCSEIVESCESADFGPDVQSDGG